MKSLSFIWLLVLSVAFASGCGPAAGSDSRTSAGEGGAGGSGGTGGIPPVTIEDPVYNAKLVRTEYGIPHTTADDWGSLGYGSGYAYAQDNFCVLMREVVNSNGESAKFFGGNSNLSRDFVWRYYNTDDYIENEFIAAAPQKLQELLHGYAAGFNRYLSETGVDNLPDGDEGCRSAPWAREVTAIDLAKVYRKLIARAGTGALAPAIIAVEAPVVTAPAVFAKADAPQSFVVERNSLLPPVTEMGSNAYAVGSNATKTGKGVLLGNPHFPWTGPERFYVSHLTIPGEYDVMGASLQGVPVVNIGFNKDVAWSHTVSTADRFALFEIAITEDDPLKYKYDDEVRDIEEIPVSAEILLGDGTLETRNETIFMTHFGPIVNLGSINVLLSGWPTIAGTILAAKDINLFNTRSLSQWLEMGQASSIAELRVAMANLGIPWVNTIAADREGTAYYADIGAMPHITEEKFADCTDTVLASIVTSQGFPTLNGARSDCELGTDPGFPEGVFGVDNMPDLVTKDFVANSNDSYWLSNPENLLEGFSRVIGAERVEQSIRTRQAFVQAGERIGGFDGLGDGGFTVELMQEVMYGNRSLAAEIVLDDLVNICFSVKDWSAYSANPELAATACDVLNPWDCRTDVDSVGVQLFTQFYNRARGLEGFWKIPFDANDAVHTPNQLNVDDASVVEGVKAALGAAVDSLVDAEIPIDRPWGEVQFRQVGEERIPIHGGSGSIGFSVISSRITAGVGYTPIRAGNSYMQTVTWDDTECPDAYAILTYSQSTDPDSPHFADMTRLYSEKGWVDMPFCASAIEEQKISETTLSNSDEPPPPDPAAELFENGPYDVGYREMELSYPAAATGESRTISLRVWYPVTPGSNADPVVYAVAGVVQIDAGVALDAPPVSGDGPFPTVVYSHGSGGQALLAYPNGELFASHGWVLVSPNHAGNTALDGLGGTSTSFAITALNRPNDISAVLNWLESGLGGDDLEGAADTSRSFLFGHSFGGYTTFAVGGADQDFDQLSAGCDGVMNENCDAYADPAVEAAYRAGFGDSRFLAIAPQAPAVVPTIVAGGLAGLTVPTMLMTGRLDMTTTQESQSVPAWMGLDNPDDIWVEMPDGGHFSFLTICDVLTPAILNLFQPDAGDDGCGPQFTPTLETVPVLNAYLLGFARQHVLGEANWDGVLRDAPLNPNFEITLP